MLSRAITHAKRAKERPLEIYIYGRRGSDSQCGYHKLIPFLETVANRIECLGLAFSVADYKDLHVSILEVTLLNCLPQMFNRLITSTCSFTSPFTYSRSEDEDNSTDSDDEGCLCLDLSHSQMEQAFSGLTVLDLNGFYPHWSSSAYHGLVDLRLVPSPASNIDIPAIHISELIKILTASPALRIFHFQLQISGPEIDDTDLVPIALKDLEVVNLSTEIRTETDWLYNIGDMLSLLGPGSKPLRLTLDPAGENYGLLDSADELRKFFERSKVEMLCLKRVEVFSDEILAYTPDVKALILGECYYGDNIFLRMSDGFDYLGNATGPGGSSDSNGTSHMLPLLNSCYICGGVIKDTTLRKLARICPVGLVLENCQVTTEPGIYITDPEELLKMFPTAKVNCLSFSSWSDLMADWDKLG
ncbi:unnamed protein product [Rhizoctonia solani]|uniref:Uncharacterized protein n=1 Tax=Rhizoctonia solani TaxID=456999 RepID=A0A8H2WGI7_9AGAM|nr:unnamed protein product [Rhizoctonia solani]CAE6439695.1 unnamed protein product [Rhizoctonia solani]